jgi:FkbM family methyltransferase
MKNNKLIFDLGFHNGDDSDFYLKKGFDVVAVEANPELAREGAERFHEHIGKKNLNLINKALSGEKGSVMFYVHPNKPDWSSCKKDMAESDGSRAKAVSVQTLSLGDLCRDFGTPLYVKVDVEGCDTVVAEQLYDLKEKPQYVSFEISKRDYADIFSWLYVSGYKKYQLVNQLNNVNRKRDPSQKTFEGGNIDYQFTKYSSGFFGRDLPENKWLTFDEVLTRYLKYKELKIADNQELALGWLDVHASL